MRTKSMFPYCGVATLTGTVDTLAEWNAAQENAFEGGASGVVDQLKIEG